jgi:hypothetical protein
LSFNGSSDFISCGAGVSLNPTTGLTLEAVFNTDKVSHTVGYSIDQCFIDKGGDGSGTLKAYSFGLSGATLRTGISLLGTSQSYGDNSKTIVVGTWYHGVGVFNGTQIITYVNAVAGTPASLSGTVKSNTSALKVGNAVFSARWVDGILEKVRIYTRALTAAEIKRLYESELMLVRG